MEMSFSMKKPYIVALTIAAGAIAVGLYAQTTRSIWDGVYTGDQAKRGQPIYNDKCASCHSSDLTGGESAPPLAGGQFMSNWEGLPASDLFTRMKTSMPQNKPGSLSGQDNADILAYMLQVGGFPAGKTELPHQAEALAGIKLESQKK
jgi:mono/diheme cytochrome c family protein